jgi:hypothetical protein
VSKHRVCAFLVFVQLMAPMSAGSAAVQAAVSRFGDLPTNALRLPGYQRVGISCIPGAADSPVPRVAVAYARPETTADAIFVLASDAEASAIIAQMCPAPSKRFLDCWNAGGNMTDWNAFCRVGRDYGLSSAQLAACWSLGSYDGPGVTNLRRGLCRAWFT